MSWIRKIRPPMARRPGQTVDAVNITTPIPKLAMFSKNDVVQEIPSSLSIGHMPITLTSIKLPIPARITSKAR